MCKNLVGSDICLAPKTPCISSREKKEPNVRVLSTQLLSYMVWISLSPFRHEIGRYSVLHYTIFKEVFNSLSILKILSFSLSFYIIELNICNIFNKKVIILYFIFWSQDIKKSKRTSNDSHEDNNFYVLDKIKHILTILTNYILLF
jgi:hypothetical protein